MPKINKSRLHFLLATIWVLVLLAYGLTLAVERYRGFSEQFHINANQKAIEKETGKPFSEWQRTQREKCSAWSSEIMAQSSGSFSSEPKERANAMYGLCIQAPASNTVSFIDILLAFLGAHLAAIIGFIAACVFMSWCFGWLLSKGLPLLFSKTWFWITSGHERR
jgi:hypothetical protein